MCAKSVDELCTTKNWISIIDLAWTGGVFGFTIKRLWSDKHMLHSSTSTLDTHVARVQTI